MRWEIVAVGVTLVAGFIAGWSVNGWRIGAQVDRLKADHARAYAEALEASKAAEKALTGQSEKIRKDTNAKIAEIRRTAAADIERVRQRQSRADLPANPAACAGSTGAQLASGDAEFLARYAADAATVNASLQACVKAYESVRQVLESHPSTRK